MTNEMSPPSLVHSWLAQDLAIPGRRRADALGDLNAEFGTRYTHSRLNEWLRGTREPDRKVRNFMLRSCIERVLAAHGVATDTLSDQHLDALADDLS